MAEVQSNEEWRPVVGFEGLYSVSNLGRVRADFQCNRWPAGRIIGNTECNGYRRVMLCRNGKTAKQVKVHRLVLEAFVGPPQGDRDDVNHIDCDRSNNRIDNLEYCTPLENMRHAKRAGRLHATAGAFKPGHRIRRKPNQILQRGEIHPDSRLTDDIVREIRSTPIKFGTRSQLARRFGVTVRSITLVLQGRTWSHV